MAPRPSSPAFFRAIGTLSLVLVTAPAAGLLNRRSRHRSDRKAFFAGASISTSHVP